MALETSPKSSETFAAPPSEGLCRSQLEQELCQAEELLMKKYKTQKFPIRQGKVDWKNVKGKLIDDLVSFSKVSRKLDVFVDNALFNGVKSLREIVFPESESDVLKQ